MNQSNAQAQPANAFLADSAYHKAPAPLDELIDAPFLPALSLSPRRQHYLLMQHRTLPEISELAEPELRLAGLRLNPQNFAPSRSWYYTQLSLGKVAQATAAKTVEGLPERPRISNIRWSRQGRFLAFTHTQAKGVELWVLNVQSRKARRVGKFFLNKSYGQPFVWHPDGESLIVKVRGKAAPLEEENQRPGPSIMESHGQARPGRTYQDLLKNPADEARFEHYLRSDLLHINLKGKVLETLSADRMHIGFQISPDGRFLLRKTLHRPFSYMFPANRFPQSIDVLNLKGEVVQQVADLPLANKIPISFDAVRPGPRRVGWQQNREAQLYWVEALDEGDPEQDVPQRDALKVWAAPFTGEPQTLMKFEDRVDAVYWGRDFALVYTDWYQKRQKQIWKIPTPEPGSQAAQSQKVKNPRNSDHSAFPAQQMALFSSENRYELPGYPLMQRQEDGRFLLKQDAQGSIYLLGQGATPEGERPFLDRWKLELDSASQTESASAVPGETQFFSRGEKTRLWRSEAPYFEKPIAYLQDQELLITRRESKNENPNYFLRQLKRNQVKALTQFPDPFPQIQGARKEIIHYTRKDGVELSAKVYTPPGWKPGDPPLPTIIWAYPREFKSVKAAGQVKGSPHSYVRASLWSPLVFLTQGYAVVHEPAMPIIGEGSREPNDRYVEQLVANAEALVNKISEMGVADPQKLAVGGHSYGAFMAANLLAHTDLFQAGIARSGAYNRTLTPFGFQSEQRSYWQAEAVYQKMSPFLQADKIKEPLLLIHGEDDPNSGTYPMQSRYFYQALKGLGAPVRLVILPHEGHSYRARESLSHVLWEMVRWLDIYLKGEADGQN